ncbi:MAG TPA: hypothetical protein PL155_08190 [Candidatus Omnitrophota bacterium]|nr:hypothetical protein [Candidatus Omnitrophota bacterium]HPD85189.1 hypothetical protein [Candidatus Omnitrophota bacterium]HRZ04310.1 hypothetical protein [Candidatus Omnitrophota bacterium]
MIKNIQNWIGSYIARETRRLVVRETVCKPTHIIFCIADHFEPNIRTTDKATERERVSAWAERYPAISKEHLDADGCHPRHTFFYPIEAYDSQQVEMLATLCGHNLSEVEIQLHHDNDTEEDLKEKLQKAKGDFSGHGLLGKDRVTSEVRFGFIHGNWALNNSRPDGRFCGVSNEIQILKEMGCYADFTLPSAPDITQTSKINSIYYAHSMGHQPKSHNTGQDVVVGKTRGDGLMIIQGPLTLNFKQRSSFIFPKIENGEIAASNLPTLNRIDLWIKQRICVYGKPDWIFVKVYTHGAEEINIKLLLDGGLDGVFSYLESRYNDKENFVLHYASAREMYNIIRAAEAGETGDPGEYRDYQVLKT